MRGLCELLDALGLTVMTETVFTRMETTQNPMGRSAQISANSTERPFRCLLLGPKPPQRAAMTAKSVLNSSVCVSTVLDNLPAMVTGKSIGETSARVFLYIISD